MMSPRIIRNKVLIALFFGLLAYIVRAASLITPLGDIFILDLRDFFVTIGAALGGPVVGLVIGICSGIPAQIPVLDLVSFSTAGVATGLIADHLHRTGKNIAWAGLGIICGYAVAAICAVILGLSGQIFYLAVRAVICVPLNIIIINNLLIAFPPLREISREIPGKGQPGTA